MSLITLAVKSLYNRRTTLLLTLLSISLSVLLFLGVEKLRLEAKNSFTQTLSGTDLIVGARGSAIQLLLYTVFRLGDATHNLSWQSYQELAAHPKVAWSIPIALGDSHRGFRVLGTTNSYFKHYRYGRKEPLSFAQGGEFNGVYEAVLGASVAATLGYRIDDELIIAHGSGATHLPQHSDKPFRIIAILAPTATPVDNTIHIPLAGMEAIHIDWQGGVRTPGFQLGAEQALQHDLTPKTMTAALLGLKSPLATFQMQRLINQYPKEPLMAIIPGVTLQQLWELVGIFEQVLRLISLLVVAISLLGLVSVLLTSLNERRREMAILRALGARPYHILGLIMGEALLLTLTAITIAFGLLYTLLLLLTPLLEQQFGLILPLGWPGGNEWSILLLLLLFTLIASLLPAWRAYRYSLSDGMRIRL
ncbi:ABC transporter permease [Ectothiorhodospiraceae bacterium BW-2]|nr:ABC transporter permease [Ectothiorhodospiraceae bacterium BW-2]